MMTSTAPDGMAKDVTPAATKGKVEQPQQAGGLSTSVQKPLAFLVLVPEQSASYPLSRPTSTPSRRGSTDSDNKDQSRPTTTVNSPVISPAINPATSTSAVNDPGVIVIANKSSRSSSMSSNGERTRFLKLGPVYWGGERGVGDWSEQD